MFTSTDGGALFYYLWSQSNPHPNLDGPLFGRFGEPWCRWSSLMIRNLRNHATVGAPLLFFTLEAMVILEVTKNTMLIISAMTKPLGVFFTFSAHDKEIILIMSPRSRYGKCLVLSSITCSCVREGSSIMSCIVLIHNNPSVFIISHKLKR